MPAGRLARVPHVDAFAESVDTAEHRFFSPDVDEPDLAIAVAGGGVGVGDLELEFGVGRLGDDALDELGGDALATSALGNGDELEVTRRGRIRELRHPLPSQDSGGKRATNNTEVAAPVRGRHPHGTPGVVGARDRSDDVTAAVRYEEPVDLHAGG